MRFLNRCNLYCGVWLKCCPEQSITFLSVTSDQTKPRPEQTGSRSLCLSLVYPPPFTRSLPSHICECNMHRLFVHNPMLVLVAVFKCLKCPILYKTFFTSFQHECPTIQHNSKRSSWQPLGRCFQPQFCFCTEWALLLFLLVVILTIFFSINYLV